MNILTIIPEIKKRNSSYNIEFLSFEEARVFVRKLRIQTVKDWQKYCINELKGYEKNQIIFQEVQNKFIEG